MTKAQTPTAVGAVTATLRNKDCFAAFTELPDNSVDAVITDPCFIDPVMCMGPTSLGDLQALNVAGLGGQGGPGGPGGNGGVAAAFTGSYTNDTDGTVVLAPYAGTTGAVGADGADGAHGADGDAVNPDGGFGDAAQDGGNGANGGLTGIDNISSGETLAFATGGIGGLGGLGGTGGTGGTGAGDNGMPGFPGDPGLDGADGTTYPDPLPEGWTLIANDGTPRVVFEAAEEEENVTPTNPTNPSPVVPAPGATPAPFTPIVPDLSESTSGSIPGVVSFSNLPAGAVVTVASNATDIRGIGTVTVVDNVVTVTPDKGFSGVTKLPVQVTVNGQTTIVEVTITVNPAPAEDGSYTPASGATWWPSPRASSGTTIVWEPSENAIGYEVWLVLSAPAGLSAQSQNRVLLCTATATSCTIDRLVGPASELELIATGNDGTRSTTVLPSYRSEAFTRVLNVMFGGNSARLTATSKAELDLLAFVMRNEGFTEVHVTSHISSNRSTKFGRDLSRNRALAVSRYLSERVGTEVTVTFESKVNTQPVASNSTRQGREANRRVEVSVR